MASNLFGVALKIANRIFPDRNKPSGLQYRLPFASQATTIHKAQLQLQPAGLEWVTGAFIDNSLNAQPVTLTIDVTGQAITVPAYSQASVELFGLTTDQFSFTATTTGNVDLSVMFFNFVPTSANTIWSVLGSTPIGTVTVNGAVTMLPTISAFVDRSLTTGALNTPQQLMPANAARKIFNIMNPYANSAKANGGLLSVSFGAGVVGGSPGAYDIAPGGSFKLDGDAQTNQAIFISASDANCVVSAFEI